MLDTFLHFTHSIGLIFDDGTWWAMATGACFQIIGMTYVNYKKKNKLSIDEGGLEGTDDTMWFLRGDTEPDS